MNQAFISNEPTIDMTDILTYAIYDVIVLDNLFNKTGHIEKLVELAKILDVSILDILHKSQA